MATPVDHVAFHARLSPARVALRDLATERAWSYGALDHAVSQYAVVLKRTFGCVAGERVASLARNTADLLILHLACARLGAIYVPLNWRLSPQELAVLIADAEPRLVFGDEELAKAGLDGTSLADLARAAAEAVIEVTEPVDPDRPSLLLYTSGTSGTPKGALLSERNLGQTAINFTLLGQVTRDSAFLVDSPMFHIIGLITNTRPALMAGAQIIISDGFQPERTVARIADRSLGVTHYFCVPQMAAMLRQAPNFDPAGFQRLTAIFTGGAPHPAADILVWLGDGVAVVDGYGLSEAGTVFGMPIDRALIAAKAGAVGAGPPAVRARIVDDEGKECPPGVAGELLLRGENIFQGYWRRPEETASAFDPDGWFRTGDIVQCDPDGFYRVLDRMKDMFISGGENVYPAEIEAALATFSGLKEWAVVGVPDARWGEVGVCALVALAGAQVAADAVHAHLEQRLARYKLPKRYLVLDALPRTASGKVIKGVLRKTAIASAKE